MTVDWTPERVAELARLRDAGFTAGKIAKRLGVTAKAIYNKLLRELGDGRTQPDTWQDERVAELHRLVDAGLSASQIGNELGGITRSAVIGKVHRLGLKLARSPSDNFRIPHRVRRRRSEVNGGGLLAGIKAARALEAAAAKRSKARAERERELLAGVSTLAAGAVIARARARGELAENGAARLAPEPIRRPPVALLELGQEHCRWPICDEADNTLGFCGEPRRGETVSYCACHCLRAFALPLNISEAERDRQWGLETMARGIYRTPKFSSQVVPTWFLTEEGEES